MKETILFLATPIAASIILAVILGYFGTHILTRRIIFIDIAVAQVAALGTMIGLLLGYAEAAWEVQLLSYLFTLLVLAGFAFLRSDSLPIPLEAVIGIIYCLGLALSILLAEYIPGGANFITKTITGSILWVTWGNVFQLVLLFTPIAVIHILFGRKFYRQSIRIGDNSSDYTLKESLWNFFFFITFGVVVVKAVLIAGIFLVFTLLIAPAVAAAMLSSSWRGRLTWSWIIGIAGTLSGILISYWLNISNGPAIVCILGSLVFIMAFVKLARPLHT